MPAAPERATPGSRLYRKNPQPRYRGDWEVEDILLIVKNEYGGKTWADVFQAVEERRNVVNEMVATLRAIKPVRPPLRGLQKQPVARFATST